MKQSLNVAKVGLVIGNMSDVMGDDDDDAFILFQGQEYHRHGQHFL
jgi:hypothetical protein